MTIKKRRDSAYLLLPLSVHAFFAILGYARCKILCGGTDSHDLHQEICTLRLLPTRPRPRPSAISEEKEDSVIYDEKFGGFRCSIFRARVGAGFNAARVHQIPVWAGLGGQEDRPKGHTLVLT